MGLFWEQTLMKTFLMNQKIRKISLTVWAFGMCENVTFLTRYGGSSKKCIDNFFGSLNLGKMYNIDSFISDQITFSCSLVLEQTENACEKSFSLDMSHM